MLFITGHHQPSENRFLGFFNKEKEIEYSFSGKIHSMLLLMSTVIKSTGFVFNYIEFHMVGIQMNSFSSSIFLSGSKTKGVGGGITDPLETLECLGDLLKASFENSLTLEKDGSLTNFFRIAIVCGVEREIIQIILHINIAEP